MCHFCLLSFAINASFILPIWTEVVIMYDLQLEGFLLYHATMYLVNNKFHFEWFMCPKGIGQF